MSSKIDTQVIVENLAELLTNSVNAASIFYDLFINPEPLTLTLQQYNDENEIITVEVENLAKARILAITGDGSPDNTVAAPQGTCYVDTRLSTVYIKVQGSGKTGWSPVLTSGTVVDLLSNYVLKTFKINGHQLTTKSGSDGITLTADDVEALPDTYKTGQSLSMTGPVLSLLDEDGNKLGSSITLGTVAANTNLDNLADDPVQGPDAGEYHFVRTGGNYAQTVTGVKTFTDVIMGTSYRALSADIAEFYEADEYLLPGTLVQFGGDKEITKAETEVNAIVSTDPAYVLNNRKEMEHPTLIALSGRIPVRVKGEVHKFDKITLGDDGVAIVDNECYNPIGRALQDNLEEGEKLVECIVKLNL